MLNSPYRLVVLSIAGGLLTSAGFVLASLHPVNNSPAWKAAWSALMILGLISLYWGIFTLRRGVRNERWSEDVIAPARRLAGRQIWLWVLGFSAAVALAALVTATYHLAYFMAASVLVQGVLQINQAFRRPGEAVDTRARLNLARVSSLSSEHWGER